MELKQIIRIILKRLWIILLLPLVAGGASAYYSYNMIQPVYQASTTLYVMNQALDPQTGINYGLLMAGQYLVQDYRELAKSRSVTEKVIQDLGLKNVTSGSLASQISVNPRNQTRIIEISVQDMNPVQAKLIADKVSEVFVQKAKDLLKVDTINIIDLAQIPLVPIEPVPTRNIAIALFVGVLIAFGIVFLIEYLDDTIKTIEDVDKQLGLNVLGIIPVYNIK